jgi:hypothetical protein
MIVGTRRDEIMQLKTLEDLLELTGGLADDVASARFRKAIEDSNISSLEDLEQWVKECLEKSGEKFNKALQDIINAVGKRLGFDVAYGLYKGKPTKLFLLGKEKV